MSGFRIEADIWSEDLRAEQEGAAGATRSHIVLLAGPGTGKTFVLVRRVQYLVEQLDVSPGEIVALTFSRAAAAEMRGRLEERLGSVGRRVKVSTLHSFALRKLLRNGAHQLPSPLRVAGDWEEREVVVEELAHLLGRHVKEVSNHKDGFLDRLSDDWDTLDADGAGWESGFPDPRFLSVWQRHREVYGYTLRSELVYQLLVELRANPDFDLGDVLELLVDEYQDLNKCDLATVALIAERTGAFVFAAGDDDQSIYSFRHALPAGIRAFGKDYDPSQRMTLTECLRCGQDVVELANWLIAQEPDREEKQLISATSWSASVHLLRFPNQESEAAAVARAVQRDIEDGSRPEDILILARSDTAGRMSNAIQAGLAAYDIHVYLPRAKLVEGDQVQRVIDYLSLAAAVADDRVDDLALRALLELDANGIGATRIDRVMRIAFASGLRFSVAIEAIRTRPDEFPSNLQAVVQASDAIVERAQSLKPGLGESFDEWLLRLSEALGLGEGDFAKLLEITRSVAGAEGLEVTDTLAIEPNGQAQGSDENGGGEVGTSLDYVDSLMDAMGSLSDVMPARMQGRVTFTTMHGAKGLTADIVYVLQAEDELIPGDAVGHYLDEARRLLYVSLTRAKNPCYRRMYAQDRATEVCWTSRGRASSFDQIP